MTGLRVFIAGAFAVMAGVPAVAKQAAPVNRPGTYAPRNECTRLSGAERFLAELRNVVARRDVPGLLALSEESIGLDYGGGSGRAELRRRLSGRDGPELWRALERVLQLGCATDPQGELILPWFFAQELGDLDPFETMLATGPAVPLYASRNVHGRRAASLNWQLVTLVQNPPAPKGFRRVSVVGSRLRGLVTESNLRSPVDYRLFASRQSGQWRISMFIAGD